MEHNVESAPAATAAWILPLGTEPGSSPLLGLDLAGGKGANLARLSQAGFPVPPGFLVTTHAYRDFVAANGLDAAIRLALPQAESLDPQALEAASAQIRAKFAQGRLPAELASALREAYARLGEGPVAVRSSATAEDLPEMSFAGQQDTFLNVIGTDELLQAIVNCWSSLWTARATGYRQRNRVPHEKAALAVVVQRMVQSEASGVMFTANPVTGLRDETVIEAALGLGEALVSGQVEPDRYVIDLKQGRVVEKTLGKKAISIRGREGGGTEVRQETGQEVQALPDTAVLDLARMGRAVADLYGFPQDIEWAWVGGHLYLLQSRPITSLYPTPEGVPPEPLRVFVSFAAVQGVNDPITPLGLDTMRHLFASLTQLFGFQHTAETQQVIFRGGERLWINITALLRNSIGRRLTYAALTFMEPTVRQAIGTLLDEPRLQPSGMGVRPGTLVRLGRFILPLAANVIRNIISPEKRRAYILAETEASLEDFRRRAAGVDGDRYEHLAQLMDLFMDYIRRDLPRIFLIFVSGVASGMASFAQLKVLADGLPPEEDAWDDRVLEVTRGLPNNPTTQMDLDLWEAAKAIRQDPASRASFETLHAAELARRYQANDLPGTIMQAVSRFLEAYGGRGLVEIDLGRPRWREDPAHVFEVLAGYLQIEPGPAAPDVVFARGAEAAQAAIERLASALRRGWLGRLKERRARFFAARARALMALRESPKFFIVRILAALRWALLETGEMFVQAGELNRPDDLFYLTFAELRLFANREARDWQGLIAARQEVYHRETLRRQIPRLLLSDGRAFYEGIQAGDGSAGELAGSPVSPGSVEGRVRVVFDPRQANLLPGEILVCPGTDPSWTPLFLTAAGLVMEVGGMMTHGAVVAREYGIPAVVGVDRATARLTTGQRILLDGSSGRITVLED